LSYLLDRTLLPRVIDAFYFGIAGVMSDVMGQYGISASEAAVASMVGQAFRLISPVIPALYMLVDSTETNFIDFQIMYVIYAWSIILIYLVV
jgi:CitMHS family citrate-Mg2+:H+ or citrate-Ca2+:H+ symporter